MADPIAVGHAALACRQEDFASWMQSEQKRVFLLCYRLLQDQDEADSAAQDAFFKAYRAMEKPEFEAVTDLTRWITRIAVNTCLDRLRSKRWQFWRRRPAKEAEQTILSMAASSQPGALDQLGAREIETRLSAALQKLSLQQRAVFTLRHYEDKALHEIAEILHLETGSVKSHLARSLVKLRGELKDLYWKNQL